MRSILKKIIFAFFSVLMLCIMALITACSSGSANENSDIIPPNTTTDLPDNLGDYNGNSNNDNNNANSFDEEVDNDSSQEGSNNEGNVNDNIEVKPPHPDEIVFDDYVLNETENFVYNLIYSDLKQQYDTFTGYIPLQNNDYGDLVEVYGISYVDYEDGYVDSLGRTYFSAGFISFANEPIIQKKEISEGLEIISLEESYDDLYSYVYSYSTNDLHMHCIVDNKYIKYDIIDNVIEYTEEPYTDGMEVDSTRGNIYSYDIEDYVYIVEEQNFVPVTGVSLLGEADYQDIMSEVNRILQTQEANFTYEEIVHYMTQSQEALYSYLLGLQEETFMGIPTSNLVEVVKDLEPLQHIRIGVDEHGYTTLEIIEVTKLATLWEKIGTSLVCAFGVVGGFVCNAIGLNIIGGAIVGAAMEAFTQVVINNTPISDIQWVQVAVAAVSGAIAGGVSGVISDITTKGLGQFILKEVADTLCDSIIGGGEFFVNSLIAGNTFEDACKNFGYGAIAGVVISGGIKVATSIIKGGAKLIKKASSTTLDSFNGNKLRKLGNEASENSISELQERAIQKNAKRNAKESIDGLMHYYDDNGKLYRIGDDLASNSEYKVNGYTYRTDSLGRKTTIKGDLSLSSNERRLTIKDSINSIGKGDQLISDHRGHIIGDRFGGSNGLENIIPQNSSLNQGQYRVLEDQWASSLKLGKKVSVDIELIYDANSFRPYAIKVKYSIDGKIDWKIFMN